MAGKRSGGCGCGGVFVSSGLAFTGVLVLAGFLAFRFIKAELDKVNEKIEEQNQNP